MKRSILSFTLLLAMVAGCGSSPSSQEPTTPSEGCPMRRHHEEMAASCPMHLDGTTARGEDVEGGAAIVFTTTGDVEALRARVAEHAAMHAERHREAGAAGGHGACPCAGGGECACPAGGCGCGHGEHAGPPPCAGGEGCSHEGCPHHRGGPHHGEGHHHGCPGAMAGATVTVENVDGGARIVFRPQDPANVDALREHVRRKVERMNARHGGGGGEHVCPCRQAGGAPATEAPAAEAPAAE